MSNTDYYDSIFSEEALLSFLYEIYALDDSELRLLIASLVYKTYIASYIQYLRNRKLLFTDSSSIQCRYKESFLPAYDALAYYAEKEKSNTASRFLLGVLYYTNIYTSVDTSIYSINMFIDEGIPYIPSENKYKLKKIYTFVKDNLQKISSLLKDYETKSQEIDLKPKDLTTLTSGSLLKLYDYVDSSIQKKEEVDMNQFSLDEWLKKPNSFTDFILDETLETADKKTCSVSKLNRLVRQIGRLKTREAFDCLERLITSDKIPPDSGLEEVSKLSKVINQAAREIYNNFWEFPYSKLPPEVPEWPPKPKEIETIFNHGQLVETFLRLIDTSVTTASLELISLCCYMGDKKVVDKLINLTKSQNEYVRFEAQFSLSQAKHCLKKGIHTKKAYKKTISQNGKQRFYEVLEELYDTTPKAS